MILPGGIIGGAPLVTAVNFTASTDMLSRAALVGASDVNQGTLSVWLNFTGLDTSNQVIFRIGGASGGGFLIFRNTNSDATANRRRKLNFNANAPAGTSRIAYISGTVLTIGTWYHVLTSWNLPGSNVFQAYFNDAADTPVVSTLSTGTIDYTNTNNGVGLGTAGTPFLACDMAEFWLGQSYIDLSIEANRRKFIKANGKPAFLGNTGQRPTGSSPLIYLKGPASNWGTNSGTGGDFTVTGTFTDATPPP